MCCFFNNEKWMVTEVKRHKNSYDVFVDAEQVILEYGIPGKKKNMVHSGGELFFGSIP